MPTFKLLHMHTSPFSERVRWVLALKRIAYESELYSVVKGEDRLAKETGQRQVPVLFVDGTALPDSTAIVRLAQRRFAPEPRLLPREPRRSGRRCASTKSSRNAVLAPEGAATRRSGGCSR